MRRILRILEISRFCCSQPGLLPRSAAHFALARWFKKPLLRNIEIAMSYRCNASCAHCCNVGLSARGRELLSIEQIRQLVDQGVEGGSLTFTIMGGEPLLSDNTLVAIEYIRARAAAAILVTNGLLASDRMIRALKRAGVFCIVFSLHGLAERHDRFTGVPGAFEAVCAGIRASLRHGVLTRVAATPTNASLEDGEFLRLAELARQHGISMHVNLPCPVGQWGGEYDQMLNPGNVRLVNRLCEKYTMTRDIHTGYEKNRCPAASCFCHVSPYGDVMPCSFVPVVFGNILEEKLCSIAARIRAAFRSVKPGYCPAAEDIAFARSYGDQPFLPAVASAIWPGNDGPASAEADRDADRSRG